MSHALTFGYWQTNQKGCALAEFALHTDFATRLGYNVSHNAQPQACTLVGVSGAKERLKEPAKVLWRYTSTVIREPQFDMVSFCGTANLKLATCCTVCCFYAILDQSVEHLLEVHFTDACTR
jgi:hypothetical protein